MRTSALRWPRWSGTRPTRRRSCAPCARAPGPPRQPGPARRPAPRRWRRGLAAAAAVSAAAAAAVIAATALGTTGPATVSLAAWSVRADAGGVVTVTVREMHDLPALQATLRAAGVRADVRLHFPAGAEAACVAHASGAALRDKIIPVREQSAEAVFRIHPDAIPAGDTLVFYLQDILGGRIGVMTTVRTPSGQCLG
jgi:hypothetical protein